MKIFRSLSRLPQHSRFNYKPRHYDPDKEAWEKKKKLKLARRALYKNSDSNLVGAFTGRFEEDELYEMNKRSKFRQLSGIFILCLMMVIPLAILWYGYPAWIGVLLFIFLIFLYRKR